MRGQHGKPRLSLPADNLAAESLQFNLSHTSTLLGAPWLRLFAVWPEAELLQQTRAGCAVTRGQAVGLDIESLLRPFRVSPLRLAKHTFSAAELDYLTGACWWAAPSACLHVRD